MKAFIKENKFLNIGPFPSDNELLKNFCYFYIVPTIAVEYILYYSVLLNAGTASYFQYANSALTFESILVLIVAFFFYSVFILGKFILAFLNILCLLQNDFQYPLTLGKKIGLLIIYLLIPGSVTATFITFIILKKSNRYNGVPLFISTVVLLVVASISFDKFIINPVLENQLKAYTKGHTRPKGEPIDPGLKQKIASYRSKYIGQSIVTKVPLFYQSGLPKDFRFNSGSLIREDRELVEFRHSCSNCLDHKRLENPLRLEYVPAGTRLKIIDSFETVSSSFGLKRGKTQYIVTEDDQKKRAEITELGFEVEVIRSNIKNFDYTPALMPLIEEFINFKELQLVYCENTYALNRDAYSDPVEKSNKINVKLHRFITDFNLQTEIEIKKTATMINRNSPGETLRCSLVDFKTLQPLYLLAYYGGDWDINAPGMRLEEFFHYQDSPFKDFDYNKFIKLSEKEALEF